jgi:hypothetical protein
MYCAVTRRLERAHILGAYDCVVGCMLWPLQRSYLVPHGDVALDIVIDCTLRKDVES